MVRADYSFTAYFGERYGRAARIRFAKIQWSQLFGALRDGKVPFLPVRRTLLHNTSEQMLPSRITRHLDLIPTIVKFWRKGAPPPSGAAAALRSPVLTGNAGVKHVLPKSRATISLGCGGATKGCGYRPTEMSSHG